MNYRPDIDGLRAVAVVPVVLFHAGVPGFGGGYVGVDVFFVISGFLITTMIAAEAREGRFSILRFYERRIRRIFPAYFAMAAVATMVAWFIVTPIDFAKFGQSLVAASCFGSNILFWLQDGYFDAPAHLKPMLHTWSLAVEEQFYVLFPLLLVGLFRWMRRWVGAVVIGLLVLSLAACIYMTKRDASMAFYHAPLRGWELLLGSLLALEVIPPLSSRVAREIATALGIAAIVWSVIAFSSTTEFPGYHALLPCGGAALVIYAGRQTTIGRVLEVPPIVFIGRISYSLYLWHWPMLVLATYYVGGPLSTPALAVVVSATVVVSVLSWRFVEQPFRNRTIAGQRRWLFAGAAISTAVTIGVGGFIWRSGGVPRRVSEEVNALDRARKDFNKDRPRCHAQDEKPIKYADKCVYGKPGVTPTIVIWGDSFAPELALALGHEAEAHDQSIIYISYSNCPPTLGLFGDVRPACDRHNADVLAEILAATSIKTVILVARYEAFYRARGDAFFPTFERLVRGLADGNKQVIVTYPIPRPAAHVPMMLARYAQRGRALNEAFIDRDGYERENSATIAFLDRLMTLPNVRGRRPADRLCDQARCEVVAGSRPLYYDDVHLSMAGAALVVPLFRDAFTSARNPR